MSLVANLIGNQYVIDLESYSITKLITEIQVWYLI